MINVSNKILKAWFELLNGNVIVNSVTIPIYRTDAPATEEGNYIIIRVESETDNSNNQKFVTNPIIITEIVTKFRTIIDDGLSAEIDSEIGNLLFPTVPGVHALPQQDDIEISQVIRQSSTYLPEDDGTFRYHRLITRNYHRVVQLQESS